MAVFFVVVTSLIFHALKLRTHEQPITIFLLPIIVSAYLGGLRPGIFATALVAVMTHNICVVLPYIPIVALSNVRWGTLMIVGVLASILSEILHCANKNIKPVEQPIEVQAQRYHQTLDMMLEGCQIIGFDWCYRYLNDSALRHAQQSREQLIGRTIMDVYPGVQETPLFSVLRIAMQERTIHRIENKFTYADGSSAWFDLSIQPSPEGLFVLSIDITDRKRAEANLYAERTFLAERVAERTADLQQVNAELAQVTQLKDEFLANMSHELRTPLTAILGRSELLLASIYGPLTPKQTEAVQSIETSGEHLLAMITDILDLTNIEAGQIKVTLSPVNMLTLCRASLQMIVQSAQAKHLTIHTAYDPQVDYITGDEQRLRQVLVKLLINAVKFTPEGGMLGLEVVGDSQAQTVNLVVWDTGIGIAADHLSQLFEPFMQVDRGLSRQYEGSGLGLSLVQRLVTVHGGRVSVESVLGQGSRFQVTLPWVKA